MRATFATALASAALLGVSAAPGLSLSLVSPESVSDVDNFTVTAIVKNTGDETLQLLKDPRTVLSTAKTHTFNVASAKGSPQFTGVFIKYFTTLAPGESLEITHNLAGVYNFTNTGAGDFQFDTASNLFQYLDASGNLATIEASTESKKVKLSGKLVSTHGLRTRSLGKRASYVGCSSSQQSALAAAATAANNYVSSASSYLNNINSGTTRYTTWFGTFDTTRFNTVKSHFSSIGADASSVTYDCSTCNVDAMAYVYADDPSRIYLCGSYWTASPTGTDSQAGTIVHELSHFTVNGGTEDHAYGQTLAKNLAKSNPQQAIFNADSHEYFAENSPALS